MDWKNIFFENAGIKLVSLVLAIVLWLNVTSRGKMEIAFTVPLELQNIPPGLTVVGNVPGYIEVRVQGQERVLRDTAIDKQISGRLDLSYAKAGENTIRISPDDIKRPSTISVAHISPYEVRLKLEPLMRKTVNLKPVLHGSPAGGVRIAGAVPKPSKIGIEGPSGVVKQITELRTLPIDVQDAVRTFTAEAKIDYEGRPVKLLDSYISVRIILERTKKE